MIQGGRDIETRDSLRTPNNFLCDLRRERAGLWPLDPRTREMFRREAAERQQWTTQGGREEREWIIAELAAMLLPLWVVEEGEQGPVAPTVESTADPVAGRSESEQAAASTDRRHEGETADSDGADQRENN